MAEEDLSGKTVLVIDDHPVVREVVGDLFACVGCGVITAADGTTGATMALEMLPDAIVSDFRKAGIDALEMLRRVRSHPRTERIPVVVMSFDDTPGVRERCLRSGATAFVRKDRGAVALVAAVAEALRREKAGRQREKAGSWSEA